MRNEIRESLMEKARALVPALRARAAWTEEHRTLPPETHAAFRDGGFYKVLHPRRFGGFELALGDMVDIAVELARGCGSSAWVFTNLVMQSWLGGMKDPRAQEELWGDDPETLVASSFPGPDATVRRVDGGFVADGTWKFSSGILFARWNHLQIFWKEDGGPAQNLFALVPACDYEVIDDWNVTALAGTGSHSLRVREAFIPDYRVTRPADTNRGFSPGSAINPGVLYRLPFWGIGGKAFAAPAVGMALGALDLIEADLGSRRAARGGARLAEQPTVQVRIAESGAEIDAAWATLARDCAEATRLTEEGVVPGIETCARWRRNNSYAIVLALRAVERIMVLNGMRGMQPNDPIQRAWRDAHAAGCQVGSAWDTQAQLYAKARFGLVTGDPRAG